MGTGALLFPFSIFPVSITELLRLPRPLPVLLPTQGTLILWTSPFIGREAVSSPALEAYKQM